MTINPDKNRLKIQGKFLAFFGIIPLLLATALFRVPCPICDGSGSVSSTGMEGVTISKVESSTQSTSLQACANYRLYNMEITLTLYNSSDRDADGFVDLYLLDYSKGTILDNEFTVEEIPAGTEVTDTFNAYFKVEVDTTGPVSVTAGVEKSGIPCKACNGTGKVALNAWPFYNSMKANFTETQRIFKPYKAPVFIQPEH
jgi:hypothetical protein